MRSYADLVALIARFKDSPSAVVANALYRIANYLKNFVTPGSAEEKQLKQFFGLQSSTQEARLGWTPVAGEANDDQLVRPYILSASLYAENQDAQNQAHQLFEEHHDQLADLPANTRPYILKNEVQQHPSQALVDQLLDLYRETADGGLKEDICFALTSLPDKDLLAQLADKYFKDAATIKPQDLRAWYRGVLVNNAGQQLAWDWLRNNWDWLDETVGGDMEFATYITVTAGIFHTSQRLAEFKNFFEPKLNTPGLTREIEMDIKIIIGKVDLVAKEAIAVNKTIAAEVK